MKHIARLSVSIILLQLAGAAAGQTPTQKQIAQSINIEQARMAAVAGPMTVGNGEHYGEARIGFLIHRAYTVDNLRCIKIRDSLYRCSHKLTTRDFDAVKQVYTTEVDEMYDRPYSWSNGALVAQVTRDRVDKALPGHRRVVAEVEEDRRRRLARSGSEYSSPSSGESESTRWSREQREFQDFKQGVQDIGAGKW